MLSVVKCGLANSLCKNRLNIKAWFNYFSLTTALLEGLEELQPVGKL